MGKSLRTTSSSGRSPCRVLTSVLLRRHQVSRRRRAPSSTTDSGPEVLLVAVRLELFGQLRAAGLGDLAVHEHVHAVRLDVAQDPRVVGDEQDALALLGTGPV